VQVVAALPTAVLRALAHRLDIRNHRKLLIIDGSVGWIGSMNIAAPEFALQPRFAPWVDCMMRMEGPATRELQLIFAEDWLLDTGENLESLLEVPPPVREMGVPVQVMASGPNFDNDAVRSLLIATIQVARREIVMTTPYFVPDPEMFGSLCVAARRGVQTHLVLPRRNNSKLVACASRARYRAMLDAGMRVHEFTAGLLHAKTITVDGSFAVITSSNLDRRSFEINFEASAIVYDSRFAAQVRSLQQSYIERSAEMVNAQWVPTLRQQLAHNAAALLSPLL
jgi:cardiolipin synthase